MNNPAFARLDRVAPKRKWGLDYILLPVYAAVLVLAMLAIVGKQRGLYQLGYKVVELRSANTALRENRDRLRAELTRLTAPDRVVAEAVALGLRPMHAGNRYTVHVDAAPVQSGGSAEEMVALMEVTR